MLPAKHKKSGNSIANNTKLASRLYPELGVSGDMTDLASNLAKRRVEQLEQDYQTTTLTAKHDLFELGSWFSLATHLDKAQLGDYSVISVTTHYSENVECQTDVTVIPQSTSYYPKPLGKQVVHGLQSATVAGSTAGEINQDEQGRVRIQFHWDTETSGDKTSCYVRVAQMLAGSGYGAQFIPRVGQEVLVSFIDGDPDQPIITGSVYNSKKTRLLIRRATQQRAALKPNSLANRMNFILMTKRQRAHLFARGERHHSRSGKTITPRR
ncbi:type VI secretion system tip protein TssI/VgrG [Vibrio sinaloensis]|nr:type VI secretion system tip protein TssI/VgrG [Vibrio sinaloensis]